jgi:MinD superfamily P-loop ATPase
MSKPIEIAVVSGKGGTGKTVLAACLAALVEDKVVADCDVDAPDLHLLLKPSIRREEIFSGKYCARIDDGICTCCGRCQEVCRFGAVVTGNEDGDETYHVDGLACEGCGVCVWACPVGAVTLTDTPGGKWFVSDTRFGKLVHACLGVAQENSGKLVTIVRSEARKLALEAGHSLVLIDGPPGVGCPVIASMAGADLAVVVTEPTLSGLHDLKRVLGLTRHFGVTTGVVVNKYDLNGEVCLQILEFLRANAIPLLGRIRFDSIVNRTLAAGKTVVEYSDSKVAREIRFASEQIMDLIRKEQDVRAAAEFKEC